MRFSKEPFEQLQQAIFILLNLQKSIQENSRFLVKKPADIIQALKQRLLFHKMGVGIY